VAELPYKRHMGKREGTDWPPRRLSAIGDRWNAILRPAWLIALAFTVIADLAGTAYVLHENFEIQPVFFAVGLTVDIDEPEGPTVGPRGKEAKQLGIEKESRIVAIDGKPQNPENGIESLTEALRNAPGPAVQLRIAAPDGRLHDYRLTRSPIHSQEFEASEPLSRDMQLAIRLATSLLACTTLLLCAGLLFLRRARDPVALLLSFGFLSLAATMDPPLLMWLGLGFGDAYDVVSSSGWVLIVVALAAFPDGRFVPAWLRWIVPLSVLLAVVLSIDEIDPTIQIPIAVLLPIGLIAMWVLRYRRLDRGIERQQIKWAASGFIAGFVLVGLAVLAALEFGDANSRSANLLIVIAFNLGLVLLPLGLLVSLTRFRLWEADVVITRSAAYAVVTVLVGIVWATSTDLVKEMVTAAMGQHNTTVSASISAVLAAGLFAPTQSLVLGYTKRRFGKYSSKLKTTAERLPAWSATASPADLGMRALAAIAESVHASRAAVLTLTPTGRELVAARGIEEPEALAAPETVPEEDPRFTLQLPLEDDDGPIGTLLLGPRSDGNRYNRDEREALQALTEPLAEAIRRAMDRVQREAGVHKMISAVEERLARIERGGHAGPDPAPA